MSSKRRGWVRPVALAIGMLAVFAVHFRPWEVGFLEEWPLANGWQMNGGWAFLPNYFEIMLSRPLHLFPSLVGLSLAGGAPGGIFLILALVAAAQVPAVIWALRPISRSFWLSGAVALFLALHPLWPGGFLQRFLPAQVAALALAVAAGLLLRWLQTGRVRWLVWAFVTLLIGFAVYPGPAAVAPLMALTLALAVRATWRRRFWAIGAVIASSAAMTLYSLVITRLIAPQATSYELGNIEEAGVKSVGELVRLIQTTLFAQGQLVLLGIVAVGLLGAILSLTGAVPNWAGWLMLGVAVASPASAIVYFGHTGWLSDIDRLGYVISLSLFAALLVWPLTSTGRQVRLEAVVAALLAIIALAGGVRGVQHWQPYVAAQHNLLTALGPAVQQASGDEIVVVIDHSGTFGRMSTFPVQYLAHASAVWNEDPTFVWLCFDDPALLPSGGSLCDVSDTGDNLKLVDTLNVETGTVDIYVGERATN